MALAAPTYVDAPPSPAAPASADVLLPQAAAGGVDVAIVEDHPALRRGLEVVFRAAGHRVVAMAGDADEAIRVIPAAQPQVVVVDIGLPGASGTWLTERLVKTDPSLGVLVYTGVGDPDRLRKALDCGARGVVLKAGPTEALLEALSTVAAGGRFVDPDLRPLIGTRASARPAGGLSLRQREILSHLAAGLTGEEIAERLSVSPETVRTHTRNVMGRLGAHTRSHAITIAIRRGEIDL